MARPVFVDDATPAGKLATEACVLVIGNFDGVHRGHRAVLEQAVRDARDAGLEACALTFDPHPSEVVGPGAPLFLTSLEDRVDLIGALGIDRVYVRRFDLAFASWTPERFARDLVARSLSAKVVVVGENFRFGARRTGDLSLLRSLGFELGFEARVHAVATDERGPYSSTRARDAIVAGDLDEAERVLGRAHAVTGIVVHGDARGHTLGFPTANLDAVPELLPRNGIYVVGVDRYDGSTFVPLGRGVTSVGVRPTITDGPQAGRRTVETYVLDYTGDLYGVRLRLHFRARLRDEKKFGSLAELTRAIGEDVARARTALF